MKLLNWIYPVHPTAPETDDVDRAMQLARRTDRRLAFIRQGEAQALERLGRRPGSVRTCRRLCDRLTRLSIERGVLESLRAEPTQRDPEIQLSSWMLRDSYAICTETPDEGMHFIVGPAVEGLWVCTSLVRFSYAQRSVAGAAGDPRATHGHTIEAAETGHRILAIAHSHPGRGAAATHPSGTDLATHRLWEQMTSLVGAIWSRDGYCRFFSAEAPFHVRVHGDHMEQIDTNLWRLRNEYHL